MVSRQTRPLVAIAALFAMAPAVGQEVRDKPNVVEYDLVIAEETMSPAGKPVQAMTINGGIPGPVLRFKVGDVARIRVKNAMREETSIHWHGLLVPNAQDGVPYLTTPPIKPGTVFEYEFPLKHSGTYWYHSHTGLQEQSGVYGSIVVTPEGGESIRVDRDYVLQLSDWTNESPYEVMKTLMRGSEYYGVKKKSLQTIAGARKADALGEYFRREWLRLPPMDLSDVAYDAFLVNGKAQLSLDGKAGEKIRLRVINSGASTNFYLDWAAGPMTIVAADGPEVEPVDVKRILIGVAETYDIVVTIPVSGAYEFRATAQDSSGCASAFLGSGEKHQAHSPPRANIYNMEEVMEVALEEGDTSHFPRPLPPYKLLKSRVPTRHDPALPVRELTLRLTGDMRRYIWSFDGKTLAEAPVIRVLKGEVLRIRMINDTMMHHPIHLHGHFFRVVNGQGNNAPLKHTIDVHPMGKQVIEFEANELGDWFFHCHMLYHMEAGMARVIRIAPEGGTLDSSRPRLDPKMIDQRYVMGGISPQSHLTEGMVKLMRGRNDFMLDGFRAYQNENEYEADLTWRRYVNQDFSTILGYRFTDIEDAQNRGIAGFAYRFPLFVYSTVVLDTEGDVRLNAGKGFQLFDRVALFLEAQYDTNTQWEGVVTLEYLLNKEFSLTVQQHSDYGFGGGITYRF